MEPFCFYKRKKTAQSLLRSAVSRNMKSIFGRESCVPGARIIIPQIFHKSGADEHRERSPTLFSLSSLLPFACVLVSFFSLIMKRFPGSFCQLVL